MENCQDTSTRLFLWVYFWNAVPSFIELTTLVTNVLLPWKMLPVLLLWLHPPNQRFEQCSPGMCQLTWHNIGSLFGRGKFVQFETGCDSWDKMKKDKPKGVLSRIIHARPRYFIYLLSREIPCSLAHFLPVHQVWNRDGFTTRNQKHNCRLTCEWQEANYLTHCLPGSVLVGNKSSQSGPIWNLT